MDRNLLLAFALSFAVLMLWTMVVDPPQPPPDGPEPEAPVAEVPQPPEAAPPEPGSLPALGPPSTGVQPLAETLPATPEEPPQGRTLRRDTGLYHAELDSIGAGITHWELRQFDTGPNAGREPIVLTTGDPPLATLLVTPFDELGFGDLSRAPFEVEEEGPDRFVFRYVRDGVSVLKSYRFPDGGYSLELTVRVENRGERNVAPRFAVTWPAAVRPGQDFKEQALALLHQGSVEREPLRGFGTPGFFSAAEPVVHYPGDVDWAGLDTTYFLGAVLPDDPADASARLVATTPGSAAVAQVFFDPVEIPPGRSAERVYRAYLGPKDPELLESFGSGLAQAIDLGWSWVAPLTRFFAWLLKALHTFVPNYGLAIIVLTVMVRLVMAPLTNRQMRSMERMRALSPKLAELKEKYGDDRQKQSEEMMKLYRREGVNPLGGCFPMVLQLPVFIGLFYALRSSIELRHAPFVGWIDDLSAPDELFEIPGLGIPLRVLPIVMGATMILQQKLTPMQQMDPAQQKMMMIMMPVMMTFVFYQFPSGLVLYWMVSNVLAIVHQLLVGRGLSAKPA